MLNKLISRLKKRTHHGAIISRLIYGVIVVSAFLIPYSGENKSAAKIIISVAGTMLMISIAEVYANIIGQRLENRKNLHKGEFKEKIREGIVLYSASTTPILFLLFAHFNIISVDTAILFAQLFAALQLFIYGYLFGRLTVSSKKISIVIGIADACIGIVIIGLKAAIH